MTLSSINEVHARHEELQQPADDNESKAPSVFGIEQGSVAAVVNVDGHGNHATEGGEYSKTSLPSVGQGELHEEGEERENEEQDGKGTSSIASVLLITDG